MNARRVTITRGGKPIGFFEGGDPEGAVAYLPGLAGDDRGLAIVVEIDDAPVAALVFPLVGDSLDIAAPVRWSSELHVERARSDAQRGTPHERGSAEGSSVLDLRGEVVASREGERHEIDFVSARYEQLFPRSPFRLELHDRSEYGFLDCRFEGEEPYGPGRARLRFHSESGQGEFRAHFYFRGKGIFGKNILRGHLRSTTEEESRAEFRFAFDFFGPGRGFGEGSFRYSGETEFPAVWLMQQCVARARGRDRPTAFRMWVGWIRYGAALAERRNVAAMLASGRSLTTADVGTIANWLALTLPEIGVENYSRAVAPLLRRIQPRELRDRQTQYAIRDLAFQFDHTVSPTQVITFLVALAKNLSEAGGRFCLTGETEESQ